MRANEKANRDEALFLRRTALQHVKITGSTGNPGVERKGTWHS